MNGTTSPSFNPFGWPFWSWPGNLGLAPEQLSQPINPGWSFGNIVVNAANSSAPETERNVLSHHSYGRQIGRLMDAVAALLDAAPKLEGDGRVREFRELAGQVAAIKRASARDRIERLCDELATVREHDPDGWARLQKLLAARR